MIRSVEAIIGKDGSVQLLEKIQLPSARRAIVTILKEKPPKFALRPHGLCEGEFTVPDEFDAPLPEDILLSFEAAEDK